MADDYSSVTSDEVLGSRSNAHSSPLFDYLSGFVPRKLKDLFKLQEYLFYNSTHIYAALNKLSDYSITDIVYDTDSSAVRQKVKELLEEKLRIKQILKACSRDRMIYGNSFVSVYLPFERFLPCKSCKLKRNIKHVDYKFKWKDQSFKWTCPACRSSVSTNIDDVEDRRQPNTANVNIIRWDAKLMDIEYNPITGKSIYYYTIPKDIKTKIQSGNKHILNTIPKGFLKSIKDEKIFEFAEGQLYHMKIDAPAGIDAQWGFPPLTSTVKQFYYTAVLRKANEAIALDHLTPLRVLHPAQLSQNGDPVQMISMQNWMQNTQDNIKRWRRDPLHIMFSPVALGVTQMGGDGRALLTLGEVEAAENNIMAAMGIPREFLYGGLSFTGSSVTLRMLENQLLSQTKDLEELMNWVCDKVTEFLGWSKVKLSLTPFKLIDDVQQKSVLLNLNANGQIISNTTLSNVFGYDIEKERDKRMQEALDEVRFQGELQNKISRLQNTLSAQARAKAQQGNASMQYDQQQVIAAADGLVQQMMQLDPGSRRSQLDALKTEDFVMYSCVKQRLEDAQKQQTQQALQQVKAQGAGGGTPSA